MEAVKLSLIHIVVESILPFIAFAVLNVDPVCRVMEEELCIGTEKKGYICGKRETDVHNTAKKIEPTEKKHSLKSKF